MHISQFKMKGLEQQGNNVPRSYALKTKIIGSFCTNEKNIIELI